MAALVKICEGRHRWRWSDAVAYYGRWRVVCARCDLARLVHAEAVVFGALVEERVRGDG